MKTFALTALLAILSNAVVAGEVGAPNPQLNDASGPSLAALIAETGASTSWAIMPFENEATVHQITELNQRVENMNAKVNEKLDALIELTYRSSLPK